MITVMDSVNRSGEKCLDPQLWHACAGGMVQMPAVNSKVYYFPQGHAEHAQGNVDFRNFSIPPLILCRVSGIKYMADPDTDEVYAKMLLVPMRENECRDDEYDGSIGMENAEKPASFAKTLTQSDANNGGGFSVPRYCADTIFPKLDYNADPPVQNILAKDVLGTVWRFRHIYRGTPRRHLLTTGWSNFVNHKKLVAGDSIVFLRAENGELCVGIRRAKKGIGSGHEYMPSWNSGAGNSGSQYDGYSAMLKEEESKMVRRNSSGRVSVESVLEAANRAANGQPFEVIYYPRASTPEFCVKVAAVRAAMRVQWCPGMRFKMAFETEDSSRISWFMGTIASVQVVDPIHWSTSPWRLLQVQWDEPDLLQNVKRVSPWLVELVSNIPPIHLNAFSPPRKKMRLPQQPDFLFNQFPVPPYSGNPLGSSSPLSCITDNIPTGIQGARHTQLGSDLRYNNFHPGLIPIGFQQLNYSSAPLSGHIVKQHFSQKENEGNVSCLLRIGNPPESLEGNNEVKTPHIFLFGKLIVTEPQSSQSCSGDTVGNSSSDGNNTNKTGVSSDGSGSALNKTPLVENSSDEGSPWHKGNKKTDLDLETGHCKVFMESDDVGRTLDLSVLGSYEELHRKLANMFDIENSETLSGVLYLDSAGSVKNTGDEPFSDFLKTARRLTILTDSGSDNTGR